MTGEPIEPAAINARAVIGSHDVVLVTLDTLRYDVAETVMAVGLTPNFARLLPAGRWQRRHSPATFTYAAHHAFFAGFLPTPLGQGPHPRLFAARFAGSESTTDNTFVLDAPDIVTGLGQCGYHTICIGGVGFFNKASPLGSVLPGLFAESHWDPTLGVTSPTSTERQVDLALERIALQSRDQRVLLFVNVSAMHQPNRMFLAGAERDSPDSMAAALTYVDRHIPRLIETMALRASVLAIVCSDHGTAYGEDGYHGHRLAHPVVWDVPYAELVLPKVRATPTGRSEISPHYR